jgi:hypothetical protein
MHVIDVVLSEAVQPGTAQVTVALDDRKSRPLEIIVGGVSAPPAAPTADAGA